jgi:predicted CXXCH cytochrome family protein
LDRDRAPRGWTGHFRTCLAGALPVLSLLLGSYPSPPPPSSEESRFQERLYAGAGGHGVDMMPSAHFELGIRCEDCHASSPGAGGLAKAGRESCNMCHDPRYGRTLARWNELLTERLAQLRQELSQVGKYVDGGSGVTQTVLANVRTNVELVQSGIGIHNVDYSLALIDAGRVLLNQGLEQAGREPLTAVTRGIQLGRPCGSCHQGIEEHSARFADLPFAHTDHFTAGLQCESCHRPHEGRPANGVVRIGKEDCAQCHHTQDSTRTDRCLTCHGELPGRSVLYQDRPFSHSVHGEALGLTCRDCHAKEGTLVRSPSAAACEACHPSQEWVLVHPCSGRGI